MMAELIHSLADSLKTDNNVCLKSITVSKIIKLTNELIKRRLVKVIPASAVLNAVATVDQSNTAEIARIYALVCFCIT